MNTFIVIVQPFLNNWGFIMKKVLFIINLIIISLILVSCKKEYIYDFYYKTDGNGKIILDNDYKVFDSDGYKMITITLSEEDDIKLVFTAKANEGYEASKWILNDKEIDNDGNEFTFLVPLENGSSKLVVEFTPVKVESEDTEEIVIEDKYALGCGEDCGKGRDAGFNDEYPSLCKNWQVIPLYIPIYNYWIDTDSLVGLTDEEKEIFINNVNKAAETWNSARIADSDKPLCYLKRQESKKLNYAIIKYTPDLDPHLLGEFYPVPLYYRMDIKYIDDFSTILHEFGHMLGLQDLDNNNMHYNHTSLMGYKSDGEMHYQDIQGLAVASNKHTEHDFRRYWYDEENNCYNYVCFYCDITCTKKTNDDGLEFVYSNACEHKYELLVSLGEKEWVKCSKCYKVIDNYELLSYDDNNLFNNNISNQYLIINLSEIDYDRFRKKII